MDGVNINLNSSSNTNSSSIVSNLISSGNVNDLETYLAQVAATAPNTINTSDVSGSLQALLDSVTNSLTNSLASTQTTPSSYQSINYLTPNTNYYAYIDNSSTSYAYSLANIPNVTLLQIYNFYQDNQDIIGTADWNNVPAVDTSTWPATVKSGGSQFWADNSTFLQYWYDMAWMTSPSAYPTSFSAPPATFDQFLQTMQKVKLVPTSDLAPVNYSFADPNGNTVTFTLPGPTQGLTTTSNGSKVWVGTPFLSTGDTSYGYTDSTGNTVTVSLVEQSNPLINIPAVLGFTYKGNQYGLYADTIPTYENSLSPPKGLTLTAQTGTLSATVQAALQSTIASMLSKFLATYQTSAPIDGTGPNTATVTASIFAQQFEYYVETSFVAQAQQTMVQVPIIPPPSGNVLYPTQYSLYQLLGSTNITNALNSAFPASFASDFSNALQNEYNSAYSVSTAGLSLLNGANPDSNPNATPSDPGAIPTATTADFNDAFTFFLNQVTTDAAQQAAAGGTGSVTIGNNFAAMWSAFVGPSYTQQTSGSVGVINGSGDYNTQLLAYMQIYYTFFPNTEGGNSADLTTKLNNFIQSMLNSPSGTFNPALDMDQWYLAIQNSYLASKGLPTVSQPLQQSNFSSAKVLMDLYSLLIQVLGDIQGLTASQTSYYNFLVKWEGAYSNAMAQIPSDLIGSMIPGGTNQTDGSNTLQASMESQIANATQKWISNLTSFSTQVSNQEKAQTTTISQSNEASNQQANLLNSIIQELQSLLQSIWR